MLICSLQFLQDCLAFAQPQLLRRCVTTRSFRAAQLTISQAPHLRRDLPNRQPRASIPRLRDRSLDVRLRRHPNRASSPSLLVPALTPSSAPPPLLLRSRLRNRHARSSRSHLSHLQEVSRPLQRRARRPLDGRHRQLAEHRQHEAAGAVHVWAGRVEWIVSSAFFFFELAALSAERGLMDLDELDHARVHLAVLSPRLDDARWSGRDGGEYAADSGDCEVRFSELAALSAERRLMDLDGLGTRPSFSASR